MFRIIPSGDAAFIIKTGDDISVSANTEVRRLMSFLEKENVRGITDFIPSYNELMVCYDPAVSGYRDILNDLRRSEGELFKMQLPEPDHITVPVVYGGEWGPDLKNIAEVTGLPEEEIISIHCGTEYLVYMLGFTPGFCYLGSVDERIAVARHTTPRLKIPKGSVGIAGSQTGIYPSESPGGWQIIGRTPIELFDPERNPAFVFSPGDKVRFKGITVEEYISCCKHGNQADWRLK